jgi:hypothetical protein
VSPNRRARRRYRSLADLPEQEPEGETSATDNENPTDQDEETPRKLDPARRWRSGRRTFFFALARRGV